MSLCDQIEYNETGVSCGTNGGEERSIQAFSGENMRKRGQLEQLSINETITLNWIFKE
jgi:hypothetical protein